MSNWKQSITSGWDLMRIVRLAIGMMLLVQGIYSRDWMIGMFSTFFLYQAVTNTGCCGTKACYMPKTRSNSVPLPVDGEVEYEEIK